MIWYYHAITGEKTKSRCVTPNGILGVNKTVFKITAETMKNKYNLTDDCTLSAAAFYDWTLHVAKRQQELE